MRLLFCHQEIDFALGKKLLLSSLGEFLNFDTSELTCSDFRIYIDINYGID